MAAKPESSDFINLIESLLGREIAPPSPTPSKGQENSVFLSLKGKETSVGGDRREARDQAGNYDADDSSRSGLLAMMTATIFPNRPKAALSLESVRAAVEDRFVKSTELGTGAEPENAYVPEIAKAGVNLASAQDLVPPVSVQLDAAPPRHDSPEPEEALRGVGSAASPSPVQLGQPPLREATPIANPTANAVQPEIKLANSPASPHLRQAPPASPADPKSPSLNAQVEPEPAPVPASPIQQPVLFVTQALPSASTVPTAIPKDRPTPARSRPIPTELKQDPPPSAEPGIAIGKIRTERPMAIDTLAFAARLSDTEDAPVPLPRTSANPTPLKNETKLNPEVLSLAPKPQARAAAPPETSNYETKQTPVEKRPEPPQPAAKAVAFHVVPVSVREDASPAPAPQNQPEVKNAAAAPETELQAKPAVQSQPAREISVQIPAGANGRVEVQIVERDGKVHVTVRGSDTQLNSALRSDLTELVRTLDQKGYKTETWTPNETYPVASTRPHELQAPARNDGAQDGSGNPSNSGGSSGGNPQQKRQQQDRPDWLIELERRLEKEG